MAAVGNFMKRMVGFGNEDHAKTSEDEPRSDVKPVATHVVCAEGDEGYDYLSSLPGFKTRVGSKPKMQLSDAEIVAKQEADVKARHPKVDFSTDEIKAREKDRDASTALEKAEKKRHESAMTKLKKKRHWLDVLEDDDNNLLVLRDFHTFSRGLTNRQDVKVENKAKRAANRLALEAAKPKQPVMPLEFREPQAPKWSSRLLRSFEPRSGSAKKCKKVSVDDEPQFVDDEAEEVSPEEAMAEDDAISAEEDAELSA